MRTTTRRGFLGASLAAAAGSCAPAALGSLFAAVSCRGTKTPKPGPAPRFELGLASYSFREFGLDETLAMARRLGFGRIALKDMHLPLDSPDGQIRAAADKVRAHGLVLYGCGVIYMSTEAEVDRAFAYARTGGMGIIIGVPDHGLLGRAEERVRETGITLAIHNHGPGDLRYPTPRTILDRISKLDPRIGVCLDVGHCARAGLDPSEEAIGCGPRLLDIHLKDVTASTAEGVAVEAGRGVIDLPRLMRTLRALAYRGTAAFEYEKDGRDPLPGLAESAGYVRGVLAAIDRGRDRAAAEDGGRG
jgi:sugar phosphate isomerase/epimerase